MYLIFVLAVYKGHGVGRHPGGVRPGPARGQQPGHGFGCAVEKPQQRVDEVRLRPEISRLWLSRRFGHIHAAALHTYDSPLGLKYEDGSLDGGHAY
jgi:hypothetical protein